jgi:hypothetical protein
MTGIYSRVYPNLDYFVRDRGLGDDVKDKLCAALRVIIRSLEDMPFVPSIAVKAVEFLFNLVGCDK